MKLQCNLHVSHLKVSRHSLCIWMKIKDGTRCHCVHFALDDGSSHVEELYENEKRAGIVQKDDYCEAFWL